MMLENDSGPCTPRLGKPNSSGMAIQSLVSRMIPVPQSHSGVAFRVAGVSESPKGYAMWALFGAASCGESAGTTSPVVELIIVRT